MRRRWMAAVAVGLAAAAAAQEATTRPSADPAAVRELVRSLSRRDGDLTPTRRYTAAAPVVRDPVRRPPPRGAPDRDATLALRASRRAYDGAPPVMPHSRNFAASRACLDCHTDGLWLGDRYAPPVPHPHLVSCQQCHVEQVNLDVPATGPAPVNDFVGLAAPGPLPRAWPGAPPLIPHGLLLRTDCLSCHGPGGWPGLGIDHPRRRNCVQCHAPGASLDATSPFAARATPR